MSKLLNANFYRLKKSKVFWILLIFSVMLPLVIIYNQYNSMVKYNNIIELNKLVFGYIPYYDFPLALFISLFLSDEYFSNTIRNKIENPINNDNKIIVSHSRTKIYLANLIITSLISILAYIIYSVVIALVGYPLFGGITISINNFIFLMFKTILIIIVFSSIFTLTVSLIKNTTLAAIGNLLIAFLFLLTAFWSSSVLSETEYINKSVITNVETNEYKYVEEKNPLYPSKTERKIYEFLLDTIPTGQAFEIAYEIRTESDLQPLYSLGVIIVLTSVGLFIFKRKEFA